MQFRIAIAANPKHCYLKQNTSSKHIVLRRKIENVMPNKRTEKRKLQSTKWFIANILQIN